VTLGQLVGNMLAATAPQLSRRKRDEIVLAIEEQAASAPPTIRAASKVRRDRMLCMLREVRRLQRLTHRELAEELGVSYITARRLRACSVSLTITEQGGRRRLAP
jgi:hypothetical protein